MIEPDGTIRVLHVDDDPEFADVATTFLEREDGRITVRTATSADEGLEALATHDVDCIVSDYDMPRTNGIEFLEAVRADRPDLPFVLFTGKGSEEIASDAISAGVSDYLQKGSGTDRYTVLANRIVNLVSQRRTEADLETRVRQQQAVATLGRQALAGVGLDALFETAVESVAGALDNEYATVLEYRPGRGDLLLRSGVGWRDGLIGEATVSDGSDSQAGHTLQSAEPVVVEDLPTEDRFRGPPLLTDHDVRSGISVIVGDEDDPWGVLGTHTTERKPFTEHDVTFVRSVANVLATAIERAERERELARSERAMDEAPVGITITDPGREDNPITYVNRHFRGLTGYPKEESLGRNHRFLQGEATDPEPVAAMRDAIATEQRVTVELRNYRRDGTGFWNRVSIAPVRDEDGSVVNYVGFQRDFSEERRRREARERQRETILELATDEAVTAGDLETALHRITETAADVLDVPRVNVWLVEEAGDGEVLACADHYDRTVGEHARGMELVVDEYPAYAEALETHQVIDAVDAREDPRTAELTDGYLDVYGVGALLDGTLRSGGDVVGVICHEHVGGKREWTDDEIDFADDVADIVHRALRNRERRERERERETTVEFLQRLYDVATDAELDAHGKITRLLEVGPEELGLPYGHLTRIEVDGGTDGGGGTQRVVEASGDHDLLQPGDSCPLSRSYCRKTIRTDGLLEVRNAITDGWGDDPAYETFRLGCYIGTSITVDDELYGTVFFASEDPREAPFTDAERTFVRLMSKLVSYELEREQVTNDLERQNDRLDAFVDVVSHDLRNPLNVAEGRLELIRAECDSEHLDAIGRAHERMRALITDLLALAREGETAADTTDVALADLARDSWRNVDTADARLVIDVGDPTVRADEGRLRQLLENLVRNSVEHGGEDVTVTVGRLDGGFYVEDTGPGIPPDERDEVFEAGYSTSPQGTGFGLNIVERVAETHGWTVRVTGGSEGGARFEVTGVAFVDE